MTRMVTSPATPEAGRRETHPEALVSSAAATHESGAVKETVCVMPEYSKSIPLEKIVWLADGMTVTLGASGCFLQEPERMRAPAQSMVMIL